jgi:hypothetical protein
MPATTFALRPVGCLAGLGSGPRARPLFTNTYAGGGGYGCWLQRLTRGIAQKLAASQDYTVRHWRRRAKSPHATRLSVPSSATALVIA